MTDEWSEADDKLLRSLIEKYGDQKKWATIAVEAGFGHDSAACEKRYNKFLNPKLDCFAFGGAAKGGAVEAHTLDKTGAPGDGFNLHYYPNPA